MNWMDGVPTPAPDGGRANIATVWSDSWLRSACNFAVHAFITDTQATIIAAGLERPLRILHLSDSHVDGGVDEPTFGEAGFAKSASFMRELYGKGLADRSSGAMGRASAEIFRARLVEAAADGVDLLVHTGDLVNCPSERSVEIIQEAVAESGLPMLYVSGNHDWQFDDLGQQHPEATPEELRDEWLHEKGHLLPLYGGRNPLCWSESVAGLTFVAIDNSTMQVSAEQLTFFEAALAEAPGAVVLLCHVPLYSAELLTAMTSRGLPNAHSYLCGDPESSNPSYRPTESTQAFLDTVGTAGSGLVAVLAGHIHTPQAQILSGDWAKFVSATQLTLARPSSSKKRLSVYTGAGADAGRAGVPAVRDGRGVLRRLPRVQFPAARLTLRTSVRGGYEPTTADLRRAAGAAGLADRGQLPRQSEQGGSEALTAGACVTARFELHGVL